MVPPCVVECIGFGAGVCASSHRGATANSRQGSSTRSINCGSQTPPRHQRHDRHIRPALAPVGRGHLSAPARSVSVYGGPKVLLSGAELTCNKELFTVHNGTPYRRVIYFALLAERARWLARTAVVRERDRIMDDRGLQRTGQARSRTHAWCSLPSSVAGRRRRPCPQEWLARAGWLPGWRRCGRRRVVSVAGRPIPGSPSSAPPPGGSRSLNRSRRMFRTVASGVKVTG